MGGGARGEGHGWHGAAESSAIKTRRRARAELTQANATSPPTPGEEREKLACAFISHVRHEWRREGGRSVAAA